MSIPPHRPDAVTSTTHRGVVRKFDPVGGFGFIRSDTLQAEVFFHKDDHHPQSDRPPNHERVPTRGDKVVFKVVPSRPNPRALPWRFAEAAVATPKPQPITKVVSLVTRDERVFFLSQWMAQRVRLEVELDWVRQAGTILRAECTCQVGLVTLERVGMWNKTTLAVYRLDHTDGCDLHPCDKLTHFVGFRFMGINVLQNPDQVELIGVQMADAPPWHRLNY